MRVLVVLDPLDRLNLETETSLLLVEELERRGHEVWMALPQDLSLLPGATKVEARRLSVQADGKPFLPAAPPYGGTLEWFDLILMRQDPPVDEAYRFAAQVLAMAEHPLVVNQPQSVLLWSEKLLPLLFPRFCPPTCVSRSPEELMAFAQQHEKLVLKPLSECSGRGIRIVEAAAVEGAIREMLAQYAGQPIVIQAYLAGVRFGDKRIFLLDGEPIGAVNRVPRSADSLANIHQGARVEATELSARETQIAAEVGSFLRQQGLWLAGLDVIDGYLTEVNVTSPSALRQINAVSNAHLERAVVDFLERAAAQKRTAALASYRSGA